MTPDEIVQQLRAMALAGQNVPSLLRYLQESLGQEDRGLMSVQYFRAAFGSGIASLSPIAGWCGFGGELDDDQVNSLVSPVLQRYRTATSQR